ncbi:SDR family NAD(P)-dependent oxidoreductase [Solirubrobacter sp. CPCC 204708]|uniref:SDR family NAD(P)-dependent oxidoreductase n=1 Tax=Solirubrobacter deserti TaxID=2282478 RepID=A0ABT4RPQ3_9ACTN|nr:SDR family NAD(P)-dependent oxidoreductase [Solirubrobacter deserti]MBE2316649.1 SDR family NAD(P)-dependent oxidoreductase [Solirubrobacter deserti]MDA0140547.1 SDR family NAD(P)-dependent oxidoreductase [Solirubrobacter deserti]
MHVLVTGASSGFGALTVRALGARGHTVYAGMRDIGERNAAAAAALGDEPGDLRAVELDVTDQDSVAAAIGGLEHLDAIVHNAGHMVLGPAEAFVPEQWHELYDVNVVGAQRVNRAALPRLRAQGGGLLVWVGSSSTRGGCPPFLAPYFAAKAAMDALAVSYAAELIRFGIDTTIVVPGAFTSGTNHFAHAGAPADTDRAADYDERYGTFMQELAPRLARLTPEDADAGAVAEKIARVIDLPAGKRPFRTHVDPTRDGSEVVSAVADRIRVEFFRRAGIDDLLTPHAAL